MVLLQGNENTMSENTAYTGFAQVYDTFMDNVPYEEWADYLAGLLKKYGAAGGLAAELGCGTGRMTRALAARGYDMIGIDNSADMLAIAMEQSSEGILYLQQDMRDFELYGTVAAVVSVCDSLNYVTEEEDLLQVFRLVNNYLDPGGLFIFDLNTVYKYRELLGERVFAESREDCAFIWDNYYDEEEGINEYDLTIFVREEGEHFARFCETHYQKAWTQESICRLLTQAGLELIAIYGAFGEEAPAQDSERLYFIAREKEKKKR